MVLKFDPQGIGFYDTGTGAVGLPQGNSAQRPKNPQPGYMRYNTDLQLMECYNNITANGANANTWGTFALGTYFAQVLVVGGGGAGSGGGGGAGGVLYTAGMLFNGGTNYQVIVGAAGNGGGNGTSSSINGLVAFGGGGASQFGASGGGVGWGGQHQWGPVALGTQGQGNPGGSGYYHSDWGHSYGGGGGAGGGGGWGTSGPGGQAGTGGPAVNYTISSVATQYGGGGAGGQGGRSWYGANHPGGYPSSGGGISYGSKGWENTGGGGMNDTGGSGVVIIQYPGSPKADGGELVWYPDQYRTPGSGYTVHTFRFSGNYRA